MTNIRESAGRGGIDLMMVVVVVLATASCGNRTVNTGPGGTGGDTGNGGAAGGGGVGGDGNADGGDYLPCPQPIPAGTACAVEAQLCVPPFECRRCVGGFKLVPFRSPLPCVCRAGQWDCRLLTSNEVGDCFVDEPLSCENARDVYLDSDCTEPAPCSP